MIDAGWAADTDFTRMVFQPWTDNFKELHMVGASYSTRLGTVNELLGNSAFGSYGDNLTVEAEIGLSDRFGKENLGEVWTALYLRYDGFQWNDKVYTTLALDTGVSMLTDTSKFELSRDSGGQSSELLHYLGPEVTFADPDNKDLEWVFRLHHRSGVFGVIDGVRAGSTFASVGVRIRF